MKDVTVLKPNQVAEFTSDQLDLIKSTVAKGATNDELKLFLYRCKNMELDPLKPGQIYFVKYGTSPGTIVVGLDGFRLKASRSGVHVGTKRGLLLNAQGKCVGAWCEIYRKDWQQPAREEVSLSEYNTGKAMWAKMPETMIKKVAEAAALRMAFPDELGGLYSHEEMDQASRDASPVKAEEVNKLLSASPAPIEPEEPDFTTEPAEELLLKDYVIPIGQKHKGKKLSELSKDNLFSFVDWVEANIKNKNPATVDFLKNARAYMEETE